MKLICKQSDLANALNIVQKAISSKTTLPILTGVLLEAKNGVLKLTGNDLSIGIEKSIEATISEEGTTVVSSRIFGDFVRKLPNDDVEIIMENKKLSIQCLKSHIDLVTYDAIEYPELPKITESNSFTISKQLFKNMIRQTIFATSQDETRPILTGSFIEIKNQKISMVAIDGFRVAIKNAGLNSSLETKIVVPAKTLNEINKIIGSQEDNDHIEIYISDKNILFKVDDIKIVSRLLEGEYVKYSQMIPNEFKTRIEINTADLLHGIERVSLLSREGKNNSIKLSIKDNLLEISSIVEIGQANDEIPLKLEGNNIDIGFNPKYLIDALKVIDSEVIYMEFLANISPCIIKPKSDEDYTYLVLPVRIPNS